MKGASLALHSVGDWVAGGAITFNGVAEKRFELHDASGKHVASCEHPNPLSYYFFANGGHALHHNYDLRLATEAEYLLTLRKG